MYMRHFLHHLFIPRESNNHRAKVLHHSTLMLLIVALIIGNIGMSFVERSNSGVLGITANFNQDDLLLQTNAKRAESGLPPLQLNPQLSQAAYQKGQDMLAKNYWAHNAPDGTTPWVFIKNSGYEYVYAGENLARGFSSAPDVVTAWMNSQGHRDNILSGNYDDVGFAVLTGTLTGDETILVVQEFGRKMAGTPSVPQNIAVAPTLAAVPTAIPIKAVLPTRAVTPTQVPIVAQVSLSPTPSTALPTSVVTPQRATGNLVASVQQNPLVDSKSFSKNFSLLLVSLFIFALIIDMIIIERKKIVRLLSHNVDHVFFFGIILLILLVIGKGTVL
jgi:hypothetical protein